MAAESNAKLFRRLTARPGTARTTWVLRRPDGGTIDVRIRRAHTWQDALAAAAERSGIAPHLLKLADRID